MIVVVEGISAAGKSTYASQFGPEHWVPEFEPLREPPTESDPAQQHAAFWVAHNIRRFQAALEVEQKHGFAISDTDPFKSHFDWCMARAGFRTMDIFNHAIPLARAAISEGKLGFANCYLVKKIEPKVARAQKEGDATRSRRNFERHLALQPHLIDWFEALAKTLPGRVEFRFPEHASLARELKSKAPENDPRRFDVAVLDELLKFLPD